MSMFSEGPVTVGICWYHPEDYQECRKLFAATDPLQDTYAEWLKQAEIIELQTKAQGAIVVRTFVDPKTFPKWCKKHGIKKMDSGARSEYSQVKAREMSQEN
ncbi:hypothetical protein [Gimesia panareensis]|uniref:hypothetical protein n=1 Tax=Gimesia panareensis TaxID=2527978 RepID=UPI00118B1B95|nr:hypothetical protein [Gimesia panareensis]QDU47716.1 hypothetical protein Pan110_00260 [Gimesia panareensis]